MPSLTTTAQLFVNPFTACPMVPKTGLKEGGWRLITAAGSAFGKRVIQLRKKEGINIIGTVRHDNLNEDLKTLGLTEVVNTETADLAVRVKQLTDGKGVPYVLDAICGHTATKRPGAWPGEVYGLLSGQDPTLNAGLLIFWELTIRGFWLTDWMRRVDSHTRQDVTQQSLAYWRRGRFNCRWNLSIRWTLSMKPLNTLRLPAASGRFC